MEMKLFDASIKDRLSEEERLEITSSLGVSVKHLLSELKIFDGDLKLVTSKGHYMKLTSTYQSSRQVHDDVCLTFVGVDSHASASTVSDLVHLLETMLSGGELPGVKSEDSVLDDKTGLWFEEQGSDMGELQSVGVYEMEFSAVEDFPCVCLGVVYTFEPELAE